MHCKFSVTCGAAWQVVGPTAVDQQSRTDRSTDAETVAALKSWGEKVAPALIGARVLGTYSGLRPATEHRDYQITTSSTAPWITVGGIRSTGLTASSGIAEHVAEQLSLLIPMAPHHATAMVGVSAAAAASDTLVPRTVCPNGVVPPLAEIAANYNARQDGMVEIYGRLWRVTHPITSFGLESLGDHENQT